MHSHTGWIWLTILHCVFKCFLKSPGWTDAKSHRLYLFDLSLLCVFKCLLISPSFENAKSHWVHLFAFSPASQCVFSNCLHQRMRSNTDCICTTSLHQSFWHVSLNYTIHAHTGNIFWASYHFACSFFPMHEFEWAPKVGMALRFSCSYQKDLPPTFPKQCCPLPNSFRNEIRALN